MEADTRARFAWEDQLPVATSMSRRQRQGDPGYNQSGRRSRELEGRGCQSLRLHRDFMWVSVAVRGGRLWRACRVHDQSSWRDLDLEGHTSEFEITVLPCSVQPDVHIERPVRGHWWSGAIQRGRVDLQSPGRIPVDLEVDSAACGMA